MGLLLTRPGRPVAMDIFPGQGRAEAAGTRVDLWRDTVLTKLLSTNVADGTIEIDHPPHT